MLIWEMDPTENYTDVTALRLRESMGLIPMLLSGQEPAAIEITNNYNHGGGYSPMDGFTMREDGTLDYPEDPPMFPIAVAENQFHETLRFYEHAWVSIQQPDGAFTVTRMD